MKIEICVKMKTLRYTQTQRRNAQQISDKTYHRMSVLINYLICINLFK